MKIIKVPSKPKVKTAKEILTTLFEFLLEKEFKDIGEVSYCNSLFIFVILIISIIYSCLLLLFPQSDTIKYPEFWYETTLIFPSVLSVYYVLSIIQECNICFDVKSLLSLRCFLKIMFTILLGFTVPYVLCYAVWTIWLGYNHPIPFVLLFCAYPMAILTNVILWYEFPNNLRQNKIFRKRLQAYMFSNVWYLIIHFQYFGLSAIFTSLPYKFQWIMAIILPMFRYVNVRVYINLVEKYAGRDNKMAMIRTNITIAIDYSMFIAIMLSSATESTLFIILGFESMLNIHLCFKILRLNRKIRTDCNVVQFWKEEMQKNIQTLVLNETIEVVVPLTYFASFLIAYYGPNSSILGGIGNDYWNYEKIEDLGKIMTVGVEMFLLDFTSILICGAILYKFCKLNLFIEFCKIIKQCWTVMTILISGKLLTVSGNI